MSFHSFSPFLWTICLKTIYLYLACKFHTHRPWEVKWTKLRQQTTCVLLISVIFCDSTRYVAAGQWVELKSRWVGHFNWFRSMTMQPSLHLLWSVVVLWCSAVLWCSGDLVQQQWCTLYILVGWTDHWAAQSTPLFPDGSPISFEMSHMFWTMDNIVNICPPLWIALLTSSVTTVTHMTEPTSVHRYPSSQVCA